MQSGTYGDVVQVSYPGFTAPMAVHAPGDFVSDALRAKGWWSQRDFILYNALLKPGDFFVDVGAHIGLYTLFAAKKVGVEGKVLAIEPEPKNYELLRKNLTLNALPHVETVQVAVGDEEGTSLLHLSTTNSGDHFVLTELPSEREVQVVAVSTLDALLSRYEKTPDVIKIDVQGGECRVLEGMKKARAAHMPKILVEFSPGLMLRAGGSPFEMFAFIEKNRLVPYRLLDDFHTGPLLLPVAVQGLLEFTQSARTSDVGWDLLLLSQADDTRLKPLLRTL